MRDASAGESAIKAAGKRYLPIPNGFATQPDGGRSMYGAYIERAQFPEIVAPSIAAMVGIVHGKQIEIETPDSMGYLWEKATSDGLTLEAFHRRITANLLRLGRYGVLADAPADGGDPYLAGYAGDLVINWESDGSFFVIDDSGMVRNGFDWIDEERYIVLRLEEGRYVQEIYDSGGPIDEPVIPTALGGQALPRIPFVVANARDISTDMVPPPLIGVARAAKAIYQLSADYRWQLFLSGQETLVAINGAAPTIIGAGAIHEMVGSGEQGTQPDLKYVSPSCKGIEAHKIAMEDNREAAIMAGAKLLAQETSNTNESGYARKLRFASETATLSTVAKVSCEVLERSLRNIAMMLGLSDAEQEKITVRPPETLMDTTLTPQEVKVLVESWQAGGFSYRTLYENLLRGGIANPEREVEDELLQLGDDPDAIIHERAEEDAA
ncbi:DUF4055 domain-containing protein [Oricola thermophila]|uniref:DUF4055 domain-containing protein n=1 Tax=Oricola thermophila TaxID=2742145 RepID=A0A6N1VA75_9HYPH|nr:DUF4055 domain-containing protein [Oricola thermophila]QKV17846.1 DUF4055 domain-containing protein [Oricola thermophila]